MDSVDCRSVAVQRRRAAPQMQQRKQQRRQPLLPLLAPLMLLALLSLLLARAEAGELYKKTLTANGRIQYEYFGYVDARGIVSTSRAQKNATSIDGQSLVGHRLARQASSWRRSGSRRVEQPRSCNLVVCVPISHPGRCTRPFPGGPQYCEGVGNPFFVPLERDC